MTTPTKRSSFEEQPLLPNPYQPIGKKRWLFASVVSLGGTGGVGYISIKSFISGTVLTGGILGAGTLICAGACAYCMYRFVDALSTRSIEPVAPTFDESATKAHVLILRAIYNQINTLLNKDVSIGLEEIVDARRFPDSIDQQLKELQLMLSTKKHEELREVKIHSIVPITDVVDVSAADSNVLMLQTVHIRLNALLDPTATFDLEQGVDDIRLHEFINQQLTDLEQMLPEMRHELMEFQEIFTAELANRSMGSASSSALNSPSADSSVEHGLFGKLDALAKKVAREQSSRNSSRHHSSYNSPMSATKSRPIVSSPTQKLKVVKLDLDTPINDGTDSDSDESAKEAKK